MRQITKDLLTDQSVPEEFRFSLRCGECGSAWHSIPIRFSKAGIRPETEGKRVIFRALYEREREQARLRAVEAAAQSFSRCPICGRLVEDCFLDNFSDYDWYGGFADYVEECGTYLALAESGTPVKASPWGGVAIAVVIALMIALVICLILKGKMKSVRKKGGSQRVCGFRRTEADGSAGSLYPHHGNPQKNRIEKFRRLRQLPRRQRRPWAQRQVLRRYGDETDSGCGADAVPAAEPDCLREKDVRENPRRHGRPERGTRPAGK